MLDALKLGTQHVLLITVSVSMKWQKRKLLLKIPRIYFNFFIKNAKKKSFPFSELKKIHLLSDLIGKVYFTQKLGHFVI